MAIDERAKDMGVSDLVKEIRKLKEKNKKLEEELMEDMEYEAMLEMRITSLEKDLAMYEKLREQLFGGLEPEDLY